MHRILKVLLLTVSALALAVGAQASTFVPSESTLIVKLGGINTMGPSAVPGSEDSVTLIDDGAGGHSIRVESSVWNTVNYQAGTSLWTGIPLISNIRWSAHWASTITFQAGLTQPNMLSHTPLSGHPVVGPYVGGHERLHGKLVLDILWVIPVTFEMSLFGGSTAGEVQSPTALGIPIRVTHFGPWVTGPVPVTGITTNIVSWEGEIGAAITMSLTPDQHGQVLSTGGGYTATGGGFPLEYHTVTVHGTNQLQSTSRDGSVTLVSPVRIDTTTAISGRVPGGAFLKMVFVPEPGTVLLLVSGAVGLVIVGRRRMRK